MTTSLVLAVVLPLFANADMVSFVSSALAGNSSEISPAISIPQQNTQKMSLLEAPINSNPQPKKQIANVNVVGGAALSNENNTPVVNRSNATGTDAVEIDYPVSDQISLYTVHPEDTLPQIAKMFNVTVNTILWANDMKKGDPITRGQLLVILPVTGVKYTVKKGDTLKILGKKFKADADNVADFNGLERGALLTVGDEIIIPDGELSVEGVAPIKTPKKAFATAKSGSGNNSQGYFTRPIIGGIRTQGIHGHNGVDLASSYGTPILAAGSGKVVVSKFGGWNGGYGNYVVIQHPNGMQTLYGHMSAVDVAVGDDVSQGFEIGKMGSTGQSTGVHLHFEVRGGVNPF